MVGHPMVARRASTMHILELTLWGRAPLRVVTACQLMERLQQEEAERKAREERARERVARAEGLLALLSPRRTVARGYAIVRDAAGGVVASAGAVAPGQALRIELRDGRVAATAEEVTR